MEILPELLGGRTARRAKSGVQRMIDPDRDLRRASAEVEISGNVDARRRLAEELSRAQPISMHAIEVFRGGLKGIFEHDPTLLLGLARAQFAKQDFAAARAALERLTQHNPDFKSADAQLLYARTLEAQDALDEAERVYATLGTGISRRRSASALRTAAQAARQIAGSAACSQGPAGRRPARSRPLSQGPG